MNRFILKAFIQNKQKSVLLILGSELTFFIQNTTGLFQYHQPIMYKTSEPQMPNYTFEPLSIAKKKNHSEK